MLLMLASPFHASAQILILPDDEYNKARAGGAGPGVVPLVPQGIYDDWYPDYVPIGSGTVLLTALGATYLLVKKKRKE